MHRPILLVINPLLYPNKMRYFVVAEVLQKLRCLSSIRQQGSMIVRKRVTGGAVKCCKPLKLSYSAGAFAAMALILSLLDVDDDEDLKDKRDPISDCTCPLIYFCRPCCLVEPISSLGDESF